MNKIRKCSRPECPRRRAALSYFCARHRDEGAAAERQYNIVPSTTQMHLTRLGLVTLAERAGFSIEPAGDGEHKRIVERTPGSQPCRCIQLWTDGRITAENPLRPEYQRAYTVAQAAAYLGLEQGNG